MTIVFNLKTFYGERRQDQGAGSEGTARNKNGPKRARDNVREKGK